MKSVFLFFLVSSNVLAADISSLNERFTVSCEGKADETLIISTSGSNPVKMDIALDRSHAVNVLNQKILVREDDIEGLPGKSREYIKTKFTKKSITIEETETYWLKSKLMYKIDVKFDDENLKSGKVTREYYFGGGSNNPVTVCKFQAK